MEKPCLSEKTFCPHCGQIPQLYYGPGEEVTKAAWKGSYQIGDITVMDYPEFWVCCEKQSKLSSSLVNSEKEVIAFEQAMKEYNAWVQWIESMPKEVFGVYKSEYEFALVDSYGNYLFPFPSKIVSNEELEAYIENGLSDPFLGDY